MIQLSELLSPTPTPLWKLVKQSGVDNVVALLDGAEQDQRMFAYIGDGKLPVAVDPERVPWEKPAIGHAVETFSDYGLTVQVIEDTPPMDKVRLGLQGRDEQIDHVITQIRAMGELDVPILCYNWSAVSGWARTNAAVPGRAGALVTGFNLAASQVLPAFSEVGETSEEQLWSALQYFLDAVIPIAEQSGVRLALHPDDPPRPTLRGISRIMRSPEAYRRMLSLVPSRSNAITFCQGNFALMSDDLPSLIREFGSHDDIAFVHFRDVRGSMDDFVETFHDEGQTDLAECMRAYHEVGYGGPMRADHVPTMEGESNDRPGYGTLGRLFAIGYIRGLEHATYGRV